MKVNLVYFKPSGKFYGEGSYETSKKHLFEIWNEVQEMALKGNVPGMALRTEPCAFIISIDVPEHEHRHPHLINIREAIIIEANESLERLSLSK